MNLEVGESGCSVIKLIPLSQQRDKLGSIGRRPKKGISYSLAKPSPPPPVFGNSSVAC